MPSVALALAPLRSTARAPREKTQDLALVFSPSSPRASFRLLHPWLPPRQALAAIDQADAAVADTAETLVGFFEDELFPGGGEDAGDDAPLA